MGLYGLKQKILSLVYVTGTHFSISLSSHFWLSATRIWISAHLAKLQWELKSLYDLKYKIFRLVYIIDTHFSVLLPSPFQLSAIRNGWWRFQFRFAGSSFFFCKFCKNFFFFKENRLSTFGNPMFIFYYLNFVIIWLSEIVNPQSPFLLTQRVQVNKIPSNIMILFSNRKKMTICASIFRLKKKKFRKSNERWLPP